MIIKLTKEYELGSKKYKEIDLKLDNLTGADLLECGKDVAERASGIKYGHLMTLGAEDFLKVVNQTKNFLVKGWGTDEDKDEKAPTEA